ncbi:hypothetical protein HpHA92_05770 [Helicobacter pylori]
MKQFPPTTKSPPPKERFKKYRLNKLSTILKNAIFFYNQRSIKTKPNFSLLAIMIRVLNESILILQYKS